MSSSTRMVLLLGLRAVPLVCFAGCDDGEASSPVSTLDASTGRATTQDLPGNGVLELKFKPMYSAYVEGHEAKLPVTFAYPPFRNKGAKFTASDPSIVSIEDTPDGALITVKREGTVTIHASLDDDTGWAKLTIKKYTEAQWKLGEARYNAPRSALVAPDGGVVSVLRIAEPGGRDPSGSCSTCHSAQAPFLRIEDTPTQTAGYTDEELINIFTTGSLPSWVDRRSNRPTFLWGANHVWTVTEDEKQGLLAYLRTKAPRNLVVESIGTRPSCLGDAGQTAALCDVNGKPITVPRGDAGVASPDAGGKGLDGGMSGDAG